MLRNRWCVVLALLLASPAFGADPPRYSAMLANGQRLHGKTLSDWHQASSMPRLDGQPLLEPGNPLRWLRDRSLPLAETPVAYVETFSGDRLPGTVVEYRSGADEPYDPQPPHLVVKPAFTLSPPAKSASLEVRVALPMVRKIVWQQRSGNEYKPATAFYRDGRSVEFRALRFSSGQVQLLLSDGLRKVDWSELAELHLEQPPAWEAYFDELAVLAATPESRLLQIETTSGLTATTSLDRLKPRFEGNPAHADGWVHGIQPAWSLDILWVPCRDVVYRRSFLAREVPLSRCTPESRPSKPSLGGAALPPQNNRNALGGLLQTAKDDFGWGWGVQSPSALAFPLPAGVKSFQSRVALDRAAGKGGCVRAAVLLNEAKGAPIWESPFLVGSEANANTGSIPLQGPEHGQAALVLRVDAAHQGRPAGADPFEIRDHADWLDPLLELDPAALKGELDRRLTQRMLAWSGWDVRLIEASANEPKLEWTTRQDERLPQPGAFHWAVATRTAAIALSRSITLSPHDRWLVIAATRPVGGGPEPKLEVRIDGAPIAEFKVPQRPANRNDARPLVVSLEPYQRPQPTTLHIEIRQLFVSADSPPVEWRAIRLAEQLPGLQRVFDEPRDVALMKKGSAAGADYDEDRHYGEQSVRIAAGESIDWRIEAPIAIREQPEWGEARHLRFAFRKKGKGRLAMELKTAAVPPKVLRYDMGQGEPVAEGTIRIWGDAPDQWVVITRDVFADFGPLDITEISVVCPDGEYALVDHVYFCRNHQDLELIPAAPSPQLTNDMAREALMKVAVERALPAVVTLQMPDGRTLGGVCIRKDEGEILTAGHALGKPNQDVMVFFPDGKSSKGKTLGVCRDLDLGLVKLADKGEWPVIPTWDRPDVPQQDIYAALTMPSHPQPGEKGEARVTSVRRQFRHDIWIDTDAAEWAPGGALIHRDGILVGLHTGRSRFGGFTFTRLQTSELNGHLARMRSGEVFGQWPVGAEPPLGFETARTTEGVVVAEAIVDGAAAQAGVQKGDVVVKIDGKEVRGAEDLVRHVAEKDAGQEVALEVRRGNEIRQVRVKLPQRMP